MPRAVAAVSPAGDGPLSSVVAVVAGESTADRRLAVCVATASNAALSGAKYRDSSVLGAPRDQI